VSDVPVVVIAGRPNVGKSTLLNRIVGERVAIVEERPGVTRDRVEVEAEWTGRRFRLVDTGGWLTGGSDLDRKVSAQSVVAVDEADLVLFVVDAILGVTEEDAAVADLLRRRGVPVVLVANKVDDAVHESAIWDLMSLGLGDPVPVSAQHGRGSGDLLDRVVAALPPADEDLDGDDAPVVEEPAGSDDRTVAVALVGRPNVGKSTLLNASRR